MRACDARITHTSANRLVITLLIRMRRHSGEGYHPGRPILHDYSVDLEARRGRSVPQMGKNCMLLYVAEFPFHYDNRENADIFEAAIK
jgi:hypothetical protein